jgi:hypothetical protein
MNEPQVAEEPLNNVELESAMLELKMALTPEEETESREKFLEVLSRSMLAVPTATAVQQGPDGSIPANTNITFVVWEKPDKITGIPAFTAAKSLKENMSQVEHGMFLSGSQMSSILADSPHQLFVISQDTNVEITQDDLKVIAEHALKLSAAQQAAVDYNEKLELAIADLLESDSPKMREAAAAAFVHGFCRLPVASEADVDKPQIVLRSENTDTKEIVQEVHILLNEGSVPCFTSETAMQNWDGDNHDAIALPGYVVAQLVATSGIPSILVNPGSRMSTVMKIDGEKVVIA